MLEGAAASRGEMPAPRTPRGVERLSAAMKESALFARFMREFGDEDSADWRDAVDQSLLIDRALFENLKGGWKIMKGERAQWLLYTAMNIQSPDEIWLEPGRQGGLDKRYYFSRFEVGRGTVLACIAVFERKQGSKGTWAGRTNYATTDEKYIYRKLSQIVDGQMLYRRVE
ncbi:PBECR2 nuclease fold domain-containing protein [Lamprobacter modestohalophilus]|uniref:PBECR2 nuclease fold domain-containing protein n=1 Tax=Lamprobacter modestohalophilus TaxID=1064514 RepID=UPI002ADEC8CE|nr:PBECR2 nuclease fold domain-containing protein [Lamprobacter modestohalophilus]MEA1051332.1 PBECR2 nuclease fold domain-containing protein [Lamprobacter modestohalophilus]